jgi:putative peptide zinc metalloprotease protein
LADDPFLPRRNRLFFGVYAIAAAAYRWVVVFSILFFLNEFFKPYRLEIIGRFMGAMSLYGLLVYPLWRLGVFFWVPGRTDMVDRTRMWISIAVVGSVLAAVVFIPVPHRVFGTFEIEPLDAKSVYVHVPGQLQEVLVKPGQKVAKGEELARLTNDKLDFAITELTGQRDQLKTQLANLNTRRFEDPSAGMEIPKIRETLAATEQQLAEKMSDQKRLVLVAPVAGTVLPAPEQQQKPPPEKELAGWTGNPFAPKNLGATLDESTMFCEIGDPNSMKAVVVIDQAEIEFLHLKQKVDIKLEELPYMTLHSEVQEIASVNLAVSPSHLTNKSGGELPTKTDDAGVERPLTTSYQVSVFPLDDADGLLRIGLRGQAKIHVAPKSIGWRLWRWFIQTFHFRL